MRSISKEGIKRGAKTFFNVAIAGYFLFGIVMSIRWSMELKKNGVFASARIEEMDGCGKSGCYAQMIFSTVESYHTGRASFMQWDGKMERGDMFLVIYLKDRPHVNYVFWDIRLPSDLDLEDDVSKYIPEEISINFLRM